MSKEPYEPNDSPAEEGSESPDEQHQEERNYTPPPTKRDAEMSAGHRYDSALYNLNHSNAHFQEARKQIAHLGKYLSRGAQKQFRRVSR